MLRDKKTTITELAERHELRMRRYRDMRAYRDGCIVPTGQWDGETGITYAEPDDARKEVIDAMEAETEKRIRDRFRIARAAAAEKRSRTYVKRNNAKDTETHKQCRCCGGVFPREEFGTDNRAHDGLAPYCRPCHRELRKKWRSKNEKDA